MDSKFNLWRACFLLMLLCVTSANPIAHSPSPGVFNLKAFGAVADGKTDNSKAFLAAWKEACAGNGRSRILIPKGTFLTKPLTFQGPCKGPVVVQLQGTVLAPADLAVFPAGRGEWIAFNYIDQLLITGGGTFDGQGASAWAANDCGKNPKCRGLPWSIAFNFVNNSTIRRISSINSKSFHMQIFACQNLTLSALTITAPGDSPNTDGIHIGSSSNIRISRSNIGTGDDCISIGPGNTNLRISGVSCGPGHGISVGSLGRSPGEKDVFGITVRNCSFTGTQNGVRIKTWPASFALSASNIRFQDIVMHNVYNPIVMDQEYCPVTNMCNSKFPSRVKISNVEFKNIKGTSASKVAINLSCSKFVPCEDVELNDIDLVYNKEGETAVSSCSNVKVRTMGRVIPRSCI